MSRRPATFALTPARLRRWPLPMPSHEGDKDARGQILIVAGAGEMPGAALLSAVAALRAGAGKLQVATCASAAPLVAAAVPEARVVALPETRGGTLATAARARLDAMAERADAIVVGPGLLGSAATERMLAGWLGALPAVPVVIDAAALGAFDHGAERIVAGPALRILTPHAGEAARLLACERDRVVAEPLELGIEMARRFDAVCVMKGSTSSIIDGPALAAGRADAIASTPLRQCRACDVGVGRHAVGHRRRACSARGSAVPGHRMGRLPARGGGRCVGRATGRATRLPRP